MAITIKDALDNLSRSLESYYYYITNVNLSVASVSETEAAIESPDILLFQYTIEEVFDDVKMLSANMGKHAISEKGGDRFDQIAITEEDREMVMKFLKAGSLYVYSKIQGLAKNIEPAYLFDEGIEILTWAADTEYAKGKYVLRNEVIYKALDTVTSDPEVDVDNWEEMPDYVDTRKKITFLISNNEQYDTNVLRVWDNNLKDIMVMYVMEKIFKFRGANPEVLSIVLDEKATKERELTGTIHSRRNPVRRYVAWM